MEQHISDCIRFLRREIRRNKRSAFLSIPHVSDELVVVDVSLSSSAKGILLCNVVIRQKVVEPDESAFKGVIGVHHVMLPGLKDPVLVAKYACDEQVTFEIKFVIGKRCNNIPKNEQVVLYEFTFAEAEKILEYSLTENPWKDDFVELYFPVKHENCSTLQCCCS